MGEVAKLVPFKERLQLVRCIKGHEYADLDAALCRGAEYPLSRRGAARKAVGQAVRFGWPRSEGEAAS